MTLPVRRREEVGPGAKGYRAPRPFPGDADCVTPEDAYMQPTVTSSFPAAALPLATPLNDH
jgi:hypothetical protein